MKYLAAQIEAESTYSLTRVLSSWGDSPFPPPPWISHLNYNLYLYMYVNNKFTWKWKNAVNALLQRILWHLFYYQCQSRNDLSLYYWCQNTEMIYYSCQNTDTIYLFTIDVKTQAQSTSLLLMSKHRNNLFLYYNTDTIYLFTIDVKTRTWYISLLLMSKHGPDLSL